MILKLDLEVEYDAAGVNRTILIEKLLGLFDGKDHEKKLTGSTASFVRSAKWGVTLIDPGKSACCDGNTSPSYLKVKRRARRRCVQCKKRRKVCKTSGLCIQECCHGPHMDSEIH